MLPKRKDLKPNGTRVSRSVQKALLAFGGMNPYGESLYRLIRAEERIIQAPGEWAIWPETATALDDRGGFNIKLMQDMLMKHRARLEDALEKDTLHEVQKLSKHFRAEFHELLQQELHKAPRTVIRGMVDVELYPYDGWVLEKWFPSSESQEDWSELTIDAMPAAGVYPYQGEYQLLAGPTPYMPTIDQLRDAIRANYREVQSRPAFTDPMRRSQERVKLMLEKAERERKAREHAAHDRAVAFRKEMDSTMKSISLGAGRVRQALADKVGLKGNYGN